DRRPQQLGGGFFVPVRSLNMIAPSRGMVFSQASDLTGTKKPPPTAEGGDLVQALGRPPYCGSSTGNLFMPLGSATVMLVAGAA
ncbi:MAG: hypothetical protein WA710_11900, partial [Pseudolabrys sp.]